MHDVSDAINILDPSKNIDKAICKKGAYNFTSGNNGQEKADKCGVKKSDHSDNSKYKQLSHMFKTPSTVSGSSSAWYLQAGEPEKKMGDKTSKTISGNISGLTREQHGVVSSAFAKAHAISL